METIKRSDTSSTVRRKLKFIRVICKALLNCCKKKDSTMGEQARPKPQIVREEVWRNFLRYSATNTNK